MTRNWEARLDSSTPGESRLSKSAHPWEVETPRMREAVLGTMPNISANLRQNSLCGDRQPVIRAETASSEWMFQRPSF
jgi:hypothetical protein